MPELRGADGADRIVPHLPQLRGEHRMREVQMNQGVTGRRRTVGASGGSGGAHILGGVLAGIEGQLERIADAAEYRAIRTMSPQTTESTNKLDELRHRIVRGT